jgi:hypothetical protein
MLRIFAATIGVLLALTASAPARARPLGQVDTFESGTTEGWFAGAGPNGGVPPTPPSVVSSGGPAGGADAYLLLTSTGTEGAPGGRLVAMNASQWAGDYAATGVSAIAMDLRNFGSTDLEIRIYLEDPITGPPSNAAVTSTSVALPAGGGWTPVVFPLTAGALAVLDGDAATLLSAVTIVRIVHAPEAAFPGPALAAVLGVDNVRVVPEPATAALVAIGLAGLARRRRR